MNREEYIRDLRLYGKANKIPNITEVNASFLKDLIKIKGAKNMLEIGTANGLSAIEFASQLELTGGKLTTIDFSEKSYTEARENIKQVGLDSIVTLIFGNALDEIPKLQQIYDFVFIDGMKRRTVDFLQLVWDKVESGGVIIIDDVIQFKEKMIGLYEHLDKNNISYHLIPIDEDDGIIMIVKISG